MIDLGDYYIGENELEEASNYYLQALGCNGNIEKRCKRDNFDKALICYKIS